MVTLNLLNFRTHSPTFAVGTKYLFEINQQQDHPVEGSNCFLRNTGSHTGIMTQKATIYFNLLYVGTNLGVSL
jgi:hypothetical protein